MFILSINSISQKIKTSNWSRCGNKIIERKICFSSVYWRGWWVAKIKSHKIPSLTLVFPHLWHFMQKYIWNTILLKWTKKKVTTRNILKVTVEEYEEELNKEDKEELVVLHLW